MYSTRWNKKRVSGFAIAVVFLYMIISRGYNKYQIDTVIKNAKPEDVWEYVADFTKMKRLNPTILDFKITADSGTFEHWKYSVLYKERLSHWPYWENIATGDYSVRKQSADEGGNFIVESHHQTCFFWGLYCLKSIGEFKFSALGSDTYVIENVLYQCPPFLGSLCKREVEFQHREIMRNLTLQLSKNT